MKLTAKIGLLVSACLASVCLQVLPAAAATTCVPNSTYRYFGGAGDTWLACGGTVGYSDGTVSAYAVGATPGVAYQLVAGCGTSNTVILNPTPVYAGSSGLIGKVTSTSAIPAGYSLICFQAVDGSTHTSPVVVVRGS